MMRRCHWVGVVRVLFRALVLGALASSAALGGEAEPGIPIAALPFANASGNPRYEPLAEAVGDMLMARLSGVRGLLFVERTALDKALAEHERSALMAPAEQVRLGQLVGAKFILTGSLTAVGDRLQLSAHLLEVATTRVARSAKAAGRTDRLVEPMDKLARELAAGLNLELRELTPAQIDKSPEASLHFMRGLGYHFAGMPDHAIAQFMKALAVRPDHARARYWNAKTYFDGGEYAHARIELSRFLREFPKHELVPEVKKMAAICAAKLKEAEARREG
jgi:TolB-like protein